MITEINETSHGIGTMMEIALTFPLTHNSDVSL